MSLTVILTIVIGIPITAGVLTIIALSKVKKQWPGAPADQFSQAKCLACRGGVQAIFTKRGVGGRGWGRIPTDLLLLNRRPDSEGGDKWGTPLASIRDCACCHGIGFHLLAPDQAESWLSCYKIAQRKAAHRD